MKKDDPLSPQRVTELIRGISRPLAFRELASRLGLSRAENRVLKRILRNLVNKGQVCRTKRGLYGPAEELNLTSGIFQSHRDGYGFVTPEVPNQRDLFIPARATLGAMDGDRVAVRIEHRGRREGRIVRILETGRTRVVGRFEHSGDVSFVSPRNRRIGLDLFIAPGDRNEARHGDRVLAEIVGRPLSPARPPQARVVKVLEKPQQPSQEVDVIIEERGLTPRFPRAVREETASVPSAVEPRMRKGRKDLRDLPTVTIDGERARDFDDAVSIAPLDQGITRLWVHIADVGEYVPWQSALDQEARRRGTSVYFPDRVIPMLPKALSNGICSLNPGEDRLALTVEMDFHRDGRRLESRFYPSVIRSDQRMTYTGVYAILGDGTGETTDEAPVDLRLMEELCLRIRQLRMSRGSLDFDLPEPEILVDLEGKPEAILKAERTVAHEIIEEFMVAANEAVAEFLAARKVPALYRIHELPDEEKIEEIRGLARAMGLRWPKGRSLHRSLAGILLALEDKPLGPLMNQLILRAMKQARYSPDNVGHFGLASECYTHFTSPIRRYPDLVVHRILKEVLAERLSDEHRNRLREELPDIGATSSRLERAAEEAEREAVAVLKTWFMREKVGETMTGRVTRVNSHGLWVQPRDIFVEGFVPVSSMADDYYRYDERSYALLGRNTGKRFGIGLEVVVIVDRVDVEDREIIFVLKNQEGTSGKTEAPRRAGRGRPQG